MNSSSPSADRVSSPTSGERSRRANEDLLLETIAVFQPCGGERLTVDDAQEIVDDVASFLELLASWDAESRPPQLVPQPSEAG